VAPYHRAPLDWLLLKRQGVPERLYSPRGWSQRYLRLAGGPEREHRDPQCVGAPVKVVTGGQCNNSINLTWTAVGRHPTRRPFPHRLRLSRLRGHWRHRRSYAPGPSVGEHDRSVKWDEVYLHDYQTVADAMSGLDRYFRSYNNERLHQALGYQTPAQVFGAAS
jgi:transposase InsO family protein